jgi:hypothetical protein
MKPLINFSVIVDMVGHRSGRPTTAPTTAPTSAPTITPSTSPTSVPTTFLRSHITELIILPSVINFLPILALLVCATVALYLARRRRRRS